MLQCLHLLHATVISFGSEPLWHLCNLPTYSKLFASLQVAFIKWLPGDTYDKQCTLYLFYLSE